jgi:ribosomal protein S18 acetylase RimI-like enzyme
MGTPMERDAISLRPIEDGDREFLLRVYASTRAEELAQIPWSEEAKARFLLFQFEAQHGHYQKHYPHAQFLVISVHGTQVGRLYVDREAAAMRMIDIALLPEHRCGGIGRLLIRELIDEAFAAGKPLSLHVEQVNPAQRLYERLGFRTIRHSGVYFLMEWRAEPALEAH